MRFLENEITQNPERGQLDHSFDVGCWIRANSRISRTERGQPCPRSSIISTRYRARQSRPRSLLNQPWMLDVCWMLDVGCWMLGVGCWVLDVGCWMLGLGCSFPACPGVVRAVRSKSGVIWCDLLWLGDSRYEESGT